MRVRCAWMLWVIFAFTHAASGAGTAAAELVSPRLAALARAVAEGDSTAEARFWREVELDSTPLIEPVPDSAGEMLVSFLWRAPAPRARANVGVYGEFGNTGNAWSTNERLKRLPGTSIWYATHRMSDRACFSYQLTWPQAERAAGEPVDTAADELALDRFVDPLNPRTFLNRAYIDKPAVRFSFATGPAAAAEPFLLPRERVRAGKVETHEFRSKVLADQRSISIYTPPGTNNGCADCAFVLMFDQAPYLLAIPTPTILDNMQADGVLPPIVAVLVGNGPFPARFTQLSPNDAFQQFVREELLPWLRARYQFSRDPQRAVVSGSSLGALAAAYTALRNPDLFGNVLSQSGSYWWWPGYDPRGDTGHSLSSEAGWLGRQFAQTPALPVRFYIEVGTWEGTLMLLPNRTFRDVLQARGYDVDYREFAGGHDYACWRASLPQGLKALLGR